VDLGVVTPAEPKMPSWLQGGQMMAEQQNEMRELQERIGSLQDAAELQQRMEQSERRNRELEEQLTNLEARDAQRTLSPREVGSPSRKSGGVAAAVAERAELEELRGRLAGFGGMSPRKVTELTNSLHSKLSLAEAELAQAQGQAAAGARGERRWRELGTGLSEDIAALRGEHEALRAGAVQQARSLGADMGWLEGELTRGIGAAMAVAERAAAAATAERRKLHNQLVDLRGSIRVFARCRPLVEMEVAGGDVPVVRVQSGGARDEVFVADERHKKSVRHEFDAVFGQEDGQAAVFQQVRRPALRLATGPRWG
jgi:hypothetical protein